MIVTIAIHIGILLILILQLLLILITTTIIIVTIASPIVVILELRRGFSRQGCAYWLIAAMHVSKECRLVVFSL